MNILAWPFGSHLILQKLSELDPKDDKSLYNKKVRRYANLGIVYEVHKLDGDLREYQRYCPFCFLKGLRCHFLDRSHFHHSLICRDCLDFKQKISKLNDKLYEKLALFTKV